MTTKTNLLASLSLLGIAIASPLAATTTQTINWGTCDSAFNGSLPIQCGNITVPLDYTTSKNSETFEIELLKVVAPKQPSRGSILFNFGGPGAPVRGSLATRGKMLQTITGEEYDLIGWDPRGTGNTLTFSCYENATVRGITALSQQLTLGNASDAALGRLWTAGRLAAENCATFERSKMTGPLVGTAFTVRDMMKIVDATNEDGLLRYWGFSYGTALGATAAAMFPDKVDKVVLDGVINPTEYYYGYDWESWSDTDATFSQFFQQCVLHPTECALANSTTTATSLETAVYDLIEQIKYQPIAFASSIFDYTALKVQIRSAMYEPERWQPFSRYLSGLLTGNQTQFAEAQASLLEKTPPIMSGGAGDDSGFGIHCSDKATRAANFEEAKPAIDRFWSTSRLQGDATNYLVFTCSQWAMEPKERYMGGFHNLKTRKPLLIMGNTWDPATPLRSAFNVTAGFEGSVLLQQNSYGHCTSKQPSLCTAKAVKDYFVNGALPKPGTVCEPEYQPFSMTQSFDGLLGQIKTY